MGPLRGWMIYSWIAIPTVMYGGYALMQLFTKSEAVTDFRRTWFRAGHAHAGVLLMLSLVFYDYLGRTTLDVVVKQVACGVFVAGILSQSGGFFIHMAKGVPERSSVGTMITSIGAVILTTAIGVLVYGMFASP